MAETEAEAEDEEEAGEGEGEAIMACRAKRVNVVVRRGTFL